MPRNTNIKRLWDVLMILKHEEDIDDVRKVETHNPTDWREKHQQQVDDVSSGRVTFVNPGSAAEVTSVRSPSPTSSDQDADRIAYQRDMQILNDPLPQWIEARDKAATPEAKHKQQIAGDKFVQGVRDKGGGGRPAPKVDSQLPLELSSVKQSNGSMDKAAGINENMMAYYRDAARRKKEADKAARTGKAAKEVPAEYSSTPNLIDTATPKSLKKSNESRILKIFKKYGL